MKKFERLATLQIVDCDVHRMSEVMVLKMSEVRVLCIVYCRSVCIMNSYIYFQNLNSQFELFNMIFM